MGVSWREDLTVGVGPIDEQHRELFKKADELAEAARSGKGSEYVSGLLGFLEDYTRFHFGEEETYMAGIGYPELAAQKAMHADFMKQVAALREEFARSGGSFSIVVKANQTVVGWLIRHISFEDKKIGRFAAQAGK